MTQFKRQQLREIRCFTCSKYFKHYYSLMQHRRGKHQDKYTALVQTFAQLKNSDYVSLYGFFCKLTQLNFPYLEIKKG